MAGAITITVAGFKFIGSRTIVVKNKSSITRSFVFASADDSNTYRFAPGGENFFG